jgi:tetratricopeptide (TPR) repeat protein
MRAMSLRAASERRRAEFVTAETHDPVLQSALTRLAVAASPESHRRVALAYYRLGIRDLAFDHFQAAVRLERSDAAAWDGMARVWRDWGFPQLGLSDAHRAVFYAPRSAAARNTLGTLLQALGNRKDARREYERAVTLNPRAAWAYNNLCNLAILDNEPAHAIDACRQSVSLDPALEVARANLAAAERQLARATSKSGSSPEAARPAHDAERGSAAMRAVASADEKREPAALVPAPR